MKKLEQQNDFGTGLMLKPDKPRLRNPKNKDFLRNLRDDLNNNAYDSNYFKFVKESLLPK